MGAGPTSVETLLKAQQTLIDEQMRDICALRDELRRAGEENAALAAQAKATKQELEREKERFLRSLQSVLGMMPKLKGHEMGEFIAACWRADNAEFQIRDALRLYEKAEQEAPIQIDTLAKQMADTLKEKR